MNIKISIAADHAGFEAKKQIISYFANSIDFIDNGCFSNEQVDYPDYALRVVDDIYSNNCRFGILVCGSGIGMAIAANRFPFIRAINTISPIQAELGRQHNNANVLCLGARLSPINEILAIIEKFLSTEFANERHKARVQKLSSKDYTSIDNIKCIIN